MQHRNIPFFIFSSSVSFSTFSSSLSLCGISSGTSRASNKAILIANRAAPEPSLLRIALVATVAIAAEDKSQAPAAVADAGLRLRKPFDDLLQLTRLMQLPDLLGPADVPATDKHPREGETLLSQNALQLF